MDGTTEPVVAVIGHPIAGNPAQFALERALKAMELEWRVLSFDVPPDEMSVALDGAEVFGMRGVLIDPTVSQAATEWFRQRQPDSDHIDCLFRGEDGRLVGHNEQRDWIVAAINAHHERLGRDTDQRIWLGEREAASLIHSDGFSDDPAATPPDPDEIAEADIIVIAGTMNGPVVLDVDDWPAGDPDTLVIDLTDGHPDLASIQRLGYQVLSIEQRRIATLFQSLRRWTLRDPPREVIHEAIEEYLAV